MLRIYGLRPDDLMGFRGKEFRALLYDMQDRLGLEREEVETMMRLKQFLESQGG